MSREMKLHGIGSIEIFSGDALITGTNTTLNGPHQKVSNIRGGTWNIFVEYDDETSKDSLKSLYAIHDGYDRAFYNNRELLNGGITGSLNHIGIFDKESSVNNVNQTPDLQEILATVIGENGVSSQVSIGDTIESYLLSIYVDVDEDRLVDAIQIELN